MPFGIMTLPLTYFFDLGLHTSAYIIIYSNYLSNYLNQNSLDLKPIEYFFHISLSHHAESYGLDFSIASGKDFLISKNMFFLVTKINNTF